MIKFNLTIIKENSKLFSKYISEILRMLLYIYEKQRKLVYNVNRKQVIVKYELIDVNIEKKMDKALQYAAKCLAESGHNEKPVLLHSFKISMTLYKFGYSEAVIISGILHDIIEDTSVKYDEILEIYGKKIANIVDAVSFNPRIEDKLAQARIMFEKCCSIGFDATIVKCADLLDNINFVNLVKDKHTKEKVLEKYEMFLEMTETIIGKENIYQLLKNKLYEIKI